MRGRNISLFNLHQHKGRRQAIRLYKQNRVSFTGWLGAQRSASDEHPDEAPVFLPEEDFFSFFSVQWVYVAALCD